MRELGMAAHGSLSLRTRASSTASQVKESVLWSMSQDVDLVVLSHFTPP